MFFKLNKHFKLEILLYKLIQISVIQNKIIIKYQKTGPHADLSKMLPATPNFTYESCPGFHNLQLFKLTNFTLFQNYFTISILQLLFDRFLVSINFNFLPAELRNSNWLTRQTSEFNYFIFSNNYYFDLRDPLHPR